MIDALIAFSLRRWPLILILAGILAAAGLVAFRELPLDAFPDVTNIQVQILTEGPGLSPIEVERFVTIPLELQMTGLPDLTEIRSLSKFALSRSRWCSKIMWTSYALASSSSSACSKPKRACHPASTRSWRR